MNSNWLGLKEIRFVNSGHFPNENIKLNDFTLLLGSSGIGKTTIMSAVCYFYTMNKEMTRPTPKEHSFYDWHLGGSNSHIIYLYENKIGKNLLLLSKEDKRVKHVFINIQNYEENIDMIYLDENNNALTIEGILANCVKNNLPYYKCETVPTFRKMMCRRSYNQLPQKNKPELDFSIFNDESTMTMYGKHLFSIYSNSSVKDKSVKDMLISLNGEKQHALNLPKFKEDLANAIKNIEYFELIKSRRNKILELDEVIIAYKGLCDEIDQVKLELETFFYNRDEVKKIINTKLQYHKASLLENIEKKKRLENEQSKKEDYYYSKKAKLKENIKNRKEDYEIFIKKNNIHTLIEEESKKEDYENSLNDLETKLNIMISSIKSIEENEKIEKDKIEAIINEKKYQEKAELEKTKETLSAKIIELLEQKEYKLQKGTFSIDQTIEKLTSEYTELNNEIIKKESIVQMLPTQDLTSSSLKRYEQTINDLIKIKESIEEKNKILENEIAQLTNERRKKLQEIENKINDEREIYYKQKNVLEKKIEEINKKLDIGRENLFGFLNKNEVPNKRKILAIASEEMLFEEKGLEYSLERSNDNFYGLKISGNVEIMASKYDIGTLENQKTSLNKQLQELTREYNVKHKSLEKELKRVSSQITKSIEKKSKESYILFPKIKNYEIKILNENKRKQDEIERLKEERKLKIISEKKQIEQNKNYLRDKQKYLDIAKNKKNIFLKEIEEEYKAEDNVLRKKLENCKEDERTLDEKYKIRLEKAYKEIHNAFSEKKINKGIDAKKIDFYKKNISRLKTTIDNINKNIFLVQRYKNEILPKYNQIPFLEKQRLSVEEEHENNMNYFKKEKNILNDKIKKNEDGTKIWSEHLTNFQDFEQKITQFKINLNRNYDSFIEDEIMELLSSKKYIIIFERYNLLVNQQSEKKKNIISRTLKIVDDIPADNMMGLKTKSDINRFNEDEDIEQYIAIADTYAEFVKTKFDINGTSLQLQRLIETINGVGSTIKYIKGNFKSILKNVHNINASIMEGIENITVIDYIKLNFKDIGQDEIVTKIEKLEGMFTANMLIGYENSDRSEVIKDQIVKAAQDLQFTLERTFKKEITVSDISSLTFDVSENSQVTKGIATLGNIGSTGTSIMVKTIIYITLLYMVTKKIRDYQNIRYHCLVDEISQISANYFSELMNYAKNLGFIFLSATASNDDDTIDAYPQIYIGTQENPTHVEFSLIDARDATEEW